MEFQRGSTPLSGSTINPKFKNMTAQEFLSKHKGNYTFKSPYHKGNKRLPFNILGNSYNDEFPVSVYTVEYRGWTKSDHYGNYRIEVLLDFINSKFIKKA